MPILSTRSSLLMCVLVGGRRQPTSYGVAHLYSLRCFGIFVKSFRGLFEDGPGAGLLCRTSSGSAPQWGKDCPNGRKKGGRWVLAPTCPP
jgi:hypothetical protein